MAALMVIYFASAMLIANAYLLIVAIRKSEQATKLMKETRDLAMRAIFRGKR